MVETLHRFMARSLMTILPAGAALLTACTVGPKYQTPNVQAPPAYKELTPENFKDTDGWKVAQPQDSALGAQWWESFGDPELNALEEQAGASNQNIAAAAANFLAARAIVKQARAQYYPSVGTNPSIAETRSPLTAPGGPASAPSFGIFALPFDASQQPDFWGRIRNTVNASVFGAQASAADLANVRLTTQAEVAVDYFEIRGQDAQKQLFDETLAAYQDSLDLARVLFQAGLTSDETLAQAETQLEATQAQDTNLGILRAQFEHAIAVLVNQPASAFSIPVRSLNPNPPAVPFGVPSQILERRPDIASAERSMAQANARIGVATAAFYPTVTLSASAGLEATSIASWFTWPSRFWSVGPALAETLFDAGARRGAVQQSQANYDQTVAGYRLTVLTAFQQVEDNLAALRILSQEIQQQDQAVGSAQRNLQIATQRYRAGIDPSSERDYRPDDVAEQPANGGQSSPAANDIQCAVDRSGWRRLEYGAVAVTERRSLEPARRIAAHAVKACSRG